MPESASSSSSSSSGLKLPQSTLKQVSQVIDVDDLEMGSQQATTSTITSSSTSTSTSSRANTRLVRPLQKSAVVSIIDADDLELLDSPLAQQTSTNNNNNNNTMLSKPVSTVNTNNNNNIKYSNNNNNNNTSSESNLVPAKNPMVEINELVKFNKIRHEYVLVDEIGPAHNKLYLVALKLHANANDSSVRDESFNGTGTSIKKAQHAAAGLAVKLTRFKKPNKSSQSSSVLPPAPPPPQPHPPLRQFQPQLLPQSPLAYQHQTRQASGSGTALTSASILSEDDSANSILSEDLIDEIDLALESASPSKQQQSQPRPPLPPPPQEPLPPLPHKISIPLLPAPKQPVLKPPVQNLLQPPPPPPPPIPIPIPMPLPLPPMTLPPPPPAAQLQNIMMPPSIQTLNSATLQAVPLPQPLLPPPFQLPALMTPFQFQQQQQQTQPTLRATTMKNRKKTPSFLFH